MFKHIIPIITMLALAGCGAHTAGVHEQPSLAPAPVPVIADIAELDGPKIPIAVYEFTDKTGQRKPNDRFSQLSSAVTQGAEVYVIDALKNIGNETWFTVLERNSLQNLTKERQLIRSTAETFDDGKSPLKALKYAGLMIEGGVVGYDSNITSGGIGARYFGIGASTEYRTDQVTVAMRIVSVQTGEILLTVLTQKSIASHSSGADVFRFLDLGTKALEVETGMAVNEPTSYAVKAAIEAAVAELVKQGEEKSFWKFKGKDYGNVAVGYYPNGKPKTTAGEKK
jgi:curli production assembly/transport component CsgG